MFFTLIFAALLSVSLAQRGSQDVVLSPSFYYFDYQLLQELSEQERNNWIISPASIKTTLGLILEGTSGSTASEISRVLRISRNITAARTVLRKVQKRMQNTPNGITVKSGSVLLAKQGLGIKNKFRTNADLYYSANITVSDFNNPQFVTKEVNKWINGLTNGNIPDIVSPDSINSETILLLANAIYFKGNWKVEFTARPSKDCFYNPECNMVQMMGTTGAFKYGEIRSLKARVLEMSYEDPRYSMIILLPKDKQSLQDVALDIQFNSIVDFLDNLATMEVNVVMPKFAIEYSLEMKPLLEKYAIEKIFSDEADFSELFQSRNRAKVSSLLHKAKIEVTEKGTEAAGATGVAEAARKPTPPPNPKSGGDLTDECPEKNGFFADGYQCDKYYECRDGVIEEKLCPDGMVFNDYSPQVEKCDLPFNIDCSERPERQTPKPSPHCPRQNGYFAHEDPGVCDKFYFCVDGKYNMITCPSGLVYNEKTGICTWPDEAKKKGCSSEDVFKFECPKVDMTQAQQHPRYPDPEDCQFFYVCINGEVPRRNGCKHGQVFNEATGSCDWPRNVPECQDWYKGILTDEELYALEHPKPRTRSNSTSVRGPPQRKQQVRVE